MTLSDTGSSRSGERAMGSRYVYVDKLFLCDLEGDFNVVNGWQIPLYLSIIFSFQKYSILLYSTINYCAQY